MEDLASRSVEGKPPHIGGDEDKVPARIRGSCTPAQDPDIRALVQILEPGIMDRFEVAGLGSADFRWP